MKKSPLNAALTGPWPAAALGLALAACGSTAELTVADGTGPSPQLPPPNPSLIPTIKTATAVGWPAGTTPTSAPGTTVKAFAANLDHPRWLYVLPNGDVLVAETNAPPKPADTGFKAWAQKLVMGRVGAGVPSANRLTLLRDTDGDGVADVRQVYLAGLNSPFGMALVGNTLYVADTDAVVKVPYTPGETANPNRPVKVADLPGGPRNHHWTKSLIAAPDGTLYAGVGSNSNVAEHGLAVEEDRARVVHVDPATGTVTPYATGLRNPVGLAWAPSGKLWVAVNERDELGSDIVPDYMTSLTPGAFYGWPWSYYGNHVDSRVEPPNPAKVASAIAPDYALGPHTASLGLAWDPANSALPDGMRGGMVVGQHGSWNRKPMSGYKVIFVPFGADGAGPSGPPVELLTGFLAPGDDDAYGRPVGVAFDRQGALLVADDVGNTIWRVAAPGRLGLPGVAGAEPTPGAPALLIATPEATRRAPAS